MTQLELRVVVMTVDGNHIGARLIRSEELPHSKWDFPDTPEGRQEAKKALLDLEDYIRKHHAKENKK